MANKNRDTPFITSIPDALKYYDENTEKFMKIRKKIKYFRVSTETSKTDHPDFSFYDGDKKLIFTSKIEIVGKYYEEYGVWAWGWALPNWNKSYSTIIRNLFIYGTDLNIFTSSTKSHEKLLLKKTLVTSRSGITDIIQIEIYCALASYLAKKQFILPFIDAPMSKSGDGYLIYTDFIQHDNHIDIDITNENKNQKRTVHYMYIINPPEL